MAQEKTAKVPAKKKRHPTFIGTHVVEPNSVYARSSYEQRKKIARSMVDYEREHKAYEASLTRAM